MGGNRIEALCCGTESTGQSCASLGRTRDTGACLFSVSTFDDSVMPETALLEPSREGLGLVSHRCREGIPSSIGCSEGVVDSDPTTRVDTRCVSRSRAAPGWRRRLFRGVQLLDTECERGGRDPDGGEENPS